jgi:signal transduction histidine kinase/DNA-binding response OmpR family regulator
MPFASLLSLRFRIGLCSFLCFCSLIFGPSAIKAQRSPERFLSLKGQARLDSLAVQQYLVGLQSDSLTALSDIESIKKYALKANEPLLSVYADFLKAIYFLAGKDKKEETVYGRLTNALQQSEKLPSSPLKNLLKAEIEHLMGVTLYQTRDYSDKCINHLLAADLIYRKIGYENILFAGYRLNFLGLYYLKRVNNPETALRYLKEGELYIKKDPSDLHRIQLYRNIALCLVEKKQYAEAIRYNQLGMAQVRSKKDSLHIGSLSGNIGEIILNHYPNPAEAESYFQKELMYRLRYRPNNYEDIAKVYSNLCQIAGLKHNKEEVVRYFNQAITTAKMDKNEAYQQAAFKELYKARMIADTLLGDYQSALRHEFLYQEALAKVNSHELKLTTSEASVRFDSEKLKLQAELANQQTQNSRFWVIVVSLLLIVAIISGYLLYYRQRTRREELARQLVYEQKEAERLSELDALKTRFFANISHEFRTPLTLLLSPLRDLQKEFPQRDLFRTMSQNAERLLSLINQLLDLSKLEAGKMEVQRQEGDLPPFLKFLFASFESLAQNKNILFQYQQNQTHRIGSFDADKLEKITTNLLSNAFKFTPENGRIEVQADYTEQELVLKVRDFGIGISQEQLPLIFDRFYQGQTSTHRDYEGTGIGLALVKELVEVLKGTIHVESEPQTGTVFTVHLPIGPPTQSPTVATTPVKENGWVTAQNFSVKTSTTPAQTDSELPVLLIVEDNIDLRHYVRSQFEGNYQILEAKDGLEGLEKAGEVIPDLVICDLMMPRLDGFGFCKALKSDMHTSHIPVIMLTAKATPEDRLEGLELGADDYLAKPFHTEELQIRVRNLIRIREQLRQKYSSQAITISAEETPKAMTHDEEFLRKLGQVMEQNIANTAFDVDLLAQQMKMSLHQLRRKLRALTGQTVIEFMRSYRLEKAALLLKDKKNNVSEVAFLVGIESLSYFSKSFQEKFGKLPSEWS